MKKGKEYFCNYTFSTMNHTFHSGYVYECRKDGTLFIDNQNIFIALNYYIHLEEVAKFKVNHKYLCTESFSFNYNHFKKGNVYVCERENMLSVNDELYHINMKHSANFKEILQIRKGYRYICLKSFRTSEGFEFLKGGAYLSDIDGSLTANNTVYIIGDKAANNFREIPQIKNGNKFKCRKSIHATVESYPINFKEGKIYRSEADGYLIAEDAFWCSVDDIIGDYDFGDHFVPYEESETKVHIINPNPESQQILPKINGVNPHSYDYNIGNVLDCLIPFTTDCLSRQTIEGRERMIVEIERAMNFLQDELNMLYNE